MSEHTSPWRVSDIQVYEAMRDEDRRFVAESLAASRGGAAGEGDTADVIHRSRNALFDLGWSTSQHAIFGVGS